jgi:hypothetical protein
MKKFAALFFLILLQRVSTAQAVNWTNLNAGLNYGVTAMCASPTYQKLFIGGSFTYVNGFPSEGLASYDSVNWTAYGLTGNIPYVSIVEYVGNVFAASGGIKRWDGIAWTDFVTFTWPTNQGAVYAMEVYNNELYVGGGFDTLNGVRANSVAKWDGSNWHDLGFWENGVNSVVHYNGDLYVAGVFYDTSGNVMNIARYDGTQWHDVGGGLHGGFGFARCLAVYNGELYVGGYFTQAEGNVGNKIQKWNGISWSDVGGGLGYYGQVDALKVFNGELYAGGGFSEAGGIPVSGIAKWDGMRWCSLGSQFDNRVEALEVFNDELYIGGGFWTIDGDSINYIAKWIGGSYVDTCSTPQGVSDVASENGISIYPNPVSDNLTIEISAFNSEKKYLSIYNVLGERMLKSQITNSKSQINVSGLARGIYIAELSSGKNIVRQKFVKQ